MSYTSPALLSNPHIQTIFSSIGPRRGRVRRDYSQFKHKDQPVILDCQDGVRLSGIYSQAAGQPAEQLAVLIHGWEGSADSSYMLSLTARLLSCNVDVFRLNLRDHGDSHHLNEGIFNSTMVPEVVSALERIQVRYPHDSCSLVGFSLGGNFAVRVAATAHNAAIELDRVIAFCPVLDASRSNQVMAERSNFIYQKYFVRKWKRSLYQKLQHFPHYAFGAELASMTTMAEMNKQLIPRFTGFDNAEDYFAAYSITGDTLRDTICPCYLHFAKDDMIIPWEDSAQLANSPNLHISLSKHGGHCGFIKNWRFESWQDDRVIELMLG